MKLCAELFTKHLTSKELNYTTRETDKGDTVVEFPYKGREAKCFFSGDEGQYLSIYMVYESVPEDKYANALIACNALNCQYKWVTCYIDDDKDILLHLDALLSPSSAAEIGFELLVRFLNISNDIKADIMKAIYA